MDFCGIRYELTLGSVGTRQLHLSDWRPYVTCNGSNGWERNRVRVWMRTRCSWLQQVQQYWRRNEFEQIQKSTPHPSPNFHPKLIQQILAAHGSRLRWYLLPRNQPSATSRTNMSMPLPMENDCYTLLLSPSKSRYDEIYPWFSTRPSQSSTHFQLRPNVIFLVKKRTLGTYRQITEPNSSPSTKKHTFFFFLGCTSASPADIFRFELDRKFIVKL